MFTVFLNIVFVLLTIDSSPLNEYCYIQNDVYYLRSFNSLIINNPQEIPNIKIRNTCIENVTYLDKIDLRNNKDFTLDMKQFDLDEIAILNYKIQKKFNLKLNFMSFKSIIIDSKEHKKMSHEVTIGVTYQYSRFLFYYEGKLVQTCNQIRHIEPYSILNYVNYYWFLMELAFRNVNICPLVFKNVSIQIFFVNTQMDTFFTKRTLKFENIDLLPNELNCKISAVYFGKVLNLKLDEKFLNYHVFKYLRDFRVTGKINFIQKDVFKNFTNIRRMIFDGQNFRQLIHKNGIEWIKSINSNINLNFSSLSDILNHLDLIVRLNVQFNYKDYVDYLSYEPILNPNNTFPDEDICLYKNFPFNQFITLVFDSYSYDTADLSNLSCTTFWLSHKIIKYEIFLNSQKKVNVSYKNLLESSKFNIMLKKCDFEMRFDLCKHQSIKPTNIRKSISDVFGILDDIDKVIVLILAPSACFLDLKISSFVSLIGLADNGLVSKVTFGYSLADT
ncbi:unnamed protein product [Brachionus calyciflorus]|uniref:Uncharacterized protein n=1 Tax=Brachionus calyciflorus TaxID=104777 RepID=A0A813XUL4_9BILA|nr:unnamed protein product [Brachionus calyciflorus]